MMFMNSGLLSDTNVRPGNRIQATSSNRFFGVSPMKKIVLSALALGSASLVAIRLLRRGSGRKLALAPFGRKDSEAARSSKRYIMYVIVPAWSLVGALDWLWHKQTNIETTSGPKESAMHLLMMAEAGVPVLAGLFLEPNAGLLRLMTIGMLLHQVTVMWNVSYTVSRRKIPAREQHTLTFMETLPFDILAVFACMHPNQFRAMLGLSQEKPDFKLKLTRPPLSLPQIIAIFGAMGLFVGLPHVEEFWRCWKARQQGLTGVDTPICAQELYA